MQSSTAKNPPAYALRPVAPPDEAFLLRLYAATRADELARTGWNAAQRDEFVRSQYHARRTDYARRYPGAEHSVVTIKDQDAGVWTVWRAPSKILLVNIELLPAHRGQGVGTALLCLLIAEAKTRHLPLHLSVKRENRAAQRLYRRLGFSAGTEEDAYLHMGFTP